MTTLAEWLQWQLHDRHLTRTEAVVYCGISGATFSEFLNKDHLPRLEILFRIADYFETPREHIIRLAARMPVEGSQPAGEDGYLVEELLDEFRKLPDDWKPEAINQLRLFVRLSTHPPIPLPASDDRKGL